VIGWLLTHGPARKALGLTLTATAILLFLLHPRRAGELAGRATLLTAMLWPTGRATAGFDVGRPARSWLSTSAPRRRARLRFATELTFLEVFRSQSFNLGSGLVLVS